MYCKKQKDRLAAVSPKTPLDALKSQPGHSDRPVQEPRVKLAWTFAAPAATSSTSSETSKKSISSCAFSAMSDITFILFSFVPPLSIVSALTQLVRVARGKVAMNYLLTLVAASNITSNTSFGLESIVCHSFFKLRIDGIVFGSDHVPRWFSSPCGVDADIAEYAL